MINIRRTKSTVPVENDLNEKSIRFEFIKKTKRTAIKINPVLDMNLLTHLLIHQMEKFLLTEIMVIFFRVYLCHIRSMILII